MKRPESETAIVQGMEAEISVGGNWGLEAKVTKDIPRISDKWPKPMGQHVDFEVHQKEEREKNVHRGKVSCRQCSLDWLDLVLGRNETKVAYNHSCDIHLSRVRLIDFL